MNDITDRLFYSIIYSNEFAVSHTHTRAHVGSQCDYGSVAQAKLPASPLHQ